MPRYLTRHWDESRGDDYDSWGPSWWCFEIAENGYVSRQIEQYESGVVLKYSETYMDDKFGGLAEKPFDAEDLAEPGWLPMTAQAFEALWQDLAAYNARPANTRRNTASRLIHASPQAVYDALITREGVATWLSPEGATMKISAFYPEPGGYFNMTLTFDSAPGESTEGAERISGFFIELVPHERVVQDFEVDSPDPAYVGRMRMRWMLEPANDGTTVILTAEDVPPGVNSQEHESELALWLTDLAAYVE